VTTFVALGDSTTLGIGDPVPGGGWRGWAAILAAGLGAGFHNLAAAGALSADVAGGQLPAALELRPDVAAVLVGVNDTLRSTFCAGRTADALERTVAALHATGAVVLTIRLPEPGRMFGLPGVLARPLARRVAEVNAVADGLAHRYGTLHFDAARHPCTYRRDMWSVDRLHPSERGHRFIAGAYHDLLAGAGFPVGERPDPRPHNPPPTRRAEVAWLATQGTRWLLRRSTDLVPQLLATAVGEWRTQRGTAPAEPGPAEAADLTLLGEPAGSP
jgi:lysophospholipase L1-like esterase